MHQRVTGDPTPKAALEVDYWSFYLAENVQWVVNRMPIQNLLSLLFSESTVGVKVLTETTNRMGTLVLEVTGECFDENANVECELHATDLRSTEKQRIIELVKLHYPITREPNRATPKRVARALGLPYK